jgi:ubiquinone/menaquinone biosynthesis C-methylase UbiE
MQLLVGHAMGRPIADVLRSLPAYEANLTQWMASLHAELDPTVRELAEIVAFAYEPVTRGLLASVLDDATRLEAGLAELVARLILSEIEPGVYEMHPLWRDHLGRLLDPDRKLRYGSRMAGHYQRRARDLLRGVGEEPSYGALYLESFPEYVNDGARHGRLVDDVMGCLRSTGLQPEPGARVLVLGAGHGTHDPGLARYDLDLVNVELLPDMAVRAMARARTLPTPIGYVVADMTRPLPFRENSFDAIVNLGSSFGYEDADADNAAMFRHAARVLRQGRPLVFEYANGGYWQRYEREIGVTTLPDGGIRTNYKVVDPQRRTSLNIISLRRPGQAPRYLHHFMHYYRLDEIVAMMADAGLEPVASYGVTAEGRVSGPFQPTHSAMVVIAVRR